MIYRDISKKTPSDLVRLRDELLSNDSQPLFLQNLQIICPKFCKIKYTEVDNNKRNSIRQLSVMSSSYI